MSGRIAAPLRELASCCGSHGRGRSLHERRGRSGRSRAAQSRQFNRMADQVQSASRRSRPSAMPCAVSWRTPPTSCARRSRRCEPSASCFRMTRRWTRVGWSSHRARDEIEAAKLDHGPPAGSHELDAGLAALELSPGALPHRLAVLEGRRSLPDGSPRQGSWASITLPDQQTSTSSTGRAWRSPCRTCWTAR